MVYEQITNQDDREEAARWLRFWRQQRDAQNRAARAATGDWLRTMHENVSARCQGRIDGFRDALQMMDGDKRPRFSSGGTSRI